MTAEEAAGLIQAEHGVRVDVVARLAGGAYDVGLGVMKIHERRADRVAAGRAAPLREALRGRGYPAPRIVFAVEREEALVIVEERLPGSARNHVDRALVEQVLRLLRTQRSAGGAPAGEPWGEFVLRALTQGLTPEEGFCLHGTLRDHGPQAARLLDRVRRRAEGLSPSDFPDTDVMHGDLHHLNVLREGTRVTGVVDWDTARMGDATYDLVTLAFCSAVARVETGVAAVLRRLAYEQGSAPEVVDAYVAFMALRQVEHAIRTGGNVRAWTAIAAAHLSASV